MTILIGDPALRHEIDKLKKQIELLTLENELLALLNEQLRQWLLANMVSIKGPSNGV
jgi:regulator of replication initiation timing